MMNNLHKDLQSMNKKWVHFTIAISIIILVFNLILYIVMWTGYYQTCTSYNKLINSIESLNLKVE